MRGFGGAAGNVLIDGARPATKNDSLDQLLQRIPASDVARIDVIRGAAPGIDMQGKTVIANVIRKTDNGLKLTTAVQGTWDANGHFDHGLRLEGSKRSGDTSYEAGLLIGTGADDGTGRGPRIVTNAALDSGRKRKRRPTMRIDEAESGGVEVATQEDPALGLHREDLKKTLYAALDRLSPTLRVTFVLFAEAGMSYKEIAATLDIPEGTVMSRIHQARQKLQAFLGHIEGIE